MASEYDPDTERSQLPKSQRGAGVERSDTFVLEKLERPLKHGLNDDQDRFPPLIVSLFVTAKRTCLAKLNNVDMSDNPNPGFALESWCLYGFGAASVILRL